MRKLVSISAAFLILFTMTFFAGCGETASSGKLITSFEEADSTRTISFDNFAGYAELTSEHATDGNTALAVTFESVSLNTKSEYAPRMAFKEGVFSGDLGNYEKIHGFTLDVFNDSSADVHLIYYTVVAENVHDANIYVLHPGANSVSIAKSRVISIGEGEFYSLYFAVSCLQAYEENYDLKLIFDNIRYEEDDSEINVPSPEANTIVSFADEESLSMIRHYSLCSDYPTTRASTDYYGTTLFPVAGYAFSPSEATGRNCLKMYFNAETLACKYMPGIEGNMRYCGFRFADEYLKKADLSAWMAGSGKRLCLSVMTDSFTNRTLTVTVSDTAGNTENFTAILAPFQWQTLEFALPDGSALNPEEIGDLRVTFDRTETKSCNFFIEKIWIGEASA